jgi:hypothetical protein
MTNQNRREFFELIGLAAVVASLLFVALELRQANLSSRIAARDSATQGHLEVIGAGIDSDVLAVALSKREQGEDLTHLERSQVDIHLWRRLKHYERVYYLYQDGVLSDEEWTGFLSSLLLSLRSSAPKYEMEKEAWDNGKPQLSPGVVSYVESGLRDSS